MSICRYRYMDVYVYTSKYTSISIYEQKSKMDVSTNGSTSSQVEKTPIFLPTPTAVNVHKET